MASSLPTAGMLDVQEAAQLAARSPETIRRWIWSGRLAAKRSGRRLLIARDDLAALVAEDGAVGTLAEWGEDARCALTSSAGTKHRSAADLVLADRRERSSPQPRR